MRGDIIHSDNVPCVLWPDTLTTDVVLSFCCRAVCRNNRPGHSALAWLFSSAGASVSVQVGMARALGPLPCPAYFFCLVQVILDYMVLRMCCATPSVNSWEGMHDWAKRLPRRLQLERELFHSWFSTQALYPGAWVWGYLYRRRPKFLLLLLFTLEYSTPTNWMFAVTKHFMLKIIGCQHLSEIEHM